MLFPIALLLFVGIAQGQAVGTLEHIHTIDPYEQMKYMREMLDDMNFANKGYKRREFILPKSKIIGLPGEQNPCSPNTFLTPIEPITGESLREAHHIVFDPPWIHGRDVFNFLLDRGLHPHHTVLEYGCGAGKNAIPIIEFVEVGHYVGIAMDEFLYHSAVDYELPFHALNEQEATFLLNKDKTSVFNVQGKVHTTSGKFDFVVISTYLQYLNANPDLKKANYEDLFNTLIASMEADGKIIIVHKENLPEADKSVLEDYFHLSVELHKWDKPVVSTEPIYFYEVTRKGR